MSGNVALGWSDAGMQGRGKREFPEKTRRQAASPVRFPHPGANPPRIEPGSPSEYSSSQSIASHRNIVEPALSRRHVVRSSVRLAKCTLDTIPPPYIYHAAIRAIVVIASLHAGAVSRDQLPWNELSRSGVRSTPLNEFFINSLPARRHTYKQPGNRFVLVLFTRLAAFWQPCRSHGDRAVTLLASHQDEPRSIPGRVTPGISQVGIVPDDAVGRWVFSGISRFPRPSFRRRSTFTSIALIGSQDLAVKSRPNFFTSQGPAYLHYISPFPLSEKRGSYKGHNGTRYKSAIDSTSRALACSVLVVLRLDVGGAIVAGRCPSLLCQPDIITAAKPANCCLKVEVKLLAFGALHPTIQREELIKIQYKHHENSQKIAIYAVNERRIAAPAEPDCAERRVLRGEAMAHLIRVAVSSLSLSRCSASSALTASRQAGTLRPRHDVNTARFARRSDGALEVRVSVAFIDPSLPDLGRRGSSHSRFTPFAETLMCHDGVVVRQLVSYQGEPSSIPGAFATGFSHVGVVLDDVAVWRVFSGFFCFSRLCIPALLHTHLTSPSSALKTSLYAKTTLLSIKLKSLRRNSLDQFTLILVVEGCVSLTCRQWRSPGTHLSFRGRPLAGGWPCDVPRTAPYNRLFIAIPGHWLAAGLATYLALPHITALFDVLPSYSLLYTVYRNPWPLAGGWPCDVPRTAPYNRLNSSRTPEKLEVTVNRLYQRTGGEIPLTWVYPLAARGNGEVLFSDWLSCSAQYLPIGWAAGRQVIHWVLICRRRSNMFQDCDAILLASVSLTIRQNGYDWFSRGCPASPDLAFRLCSIFHINLIGSQYLDVKSRPNIFTHSLL
ncbi:hypothetical protein PR048_022749 [Dryococelus australis]|uniref:Uncharacterized protein n=1 Tax=Dryococelus australis TaxID=614101 RepID=A0ABQ9GS94_9NEOP|nr:hypothetical protein PR048_022749 [Dryococelus australis]